MDELALIFDDLVRRVIDGTATPEERCRMAELMRDDSDLQMHYCRHMRIHALLTCCGGQVKMEDGAKGGKLAVGRWQPAVGNRQSGLRIWWKTGWKIAAAAVIAVGVTTWLLMLAGSILRSDHIGHGHAFSSPVALMYGESIIGLDLPSQLPGTLRLASGQAKVRLTSGAELTLLGPLELEIRDAMRVKLEMGRLLAYVPPVASGFTVLTRELEIWDIGTVFSVTVSKGASDVFVFQGSVQVVEADGEPVDLCESGQGVRAVADRRPCKVAADWPEAESRFAGVKGPKALKNPGQALRVADEVTLAWIERYEPEEVSLFRERLANAWAAAEAAKRVPFSKSAWVRPVASVPPQEENMTTTKVAMMAAAALFMGSETSSGTSLPVRIDTSPVHNLNWMTLFTNEVPLRWEWPDTATAAELTVTGMRESFVTNFTSETTNLLWRPFTTALPREEEVYALTLSFFDSGEKEVQTLTAKLVALAGAFGAVPVDPGPSDRRWGKVKANAVIPYDATWTAATADAAASRLVIAKTGGATQEYLTGDASGYFGWKLVNGDWGYGVFALTLDFPGFDGTWEAALAYMPGGTMLTVR